MTSFLRILQISSARSFGGGERYLASLTNSLAARGHELYLALPASSPLRTEVLALPRRRIIETPLLNAVDILSTLKLAAIIKKRDIEIVHAHIARDYPLASLAVGHSNSARLVITRHVLFPLHWIHSHLLSDVARVIAVSEAVKQSLEQSGIFPDSKICVIRNGIDIQHFETARKNGAGDKFRNQFKIKSERRLVGTVGALKDLKGHEEFLRAASIVARTFGDVDFVICGEDPRPSGKYRAGLVDLIKTLGLENRVRLIGRLHDIAPLLCALNIFVSSSRSESFGLVLVEAMASGTPVVATATDGALQIIDDDGSGRLVPVGDVNALAGTINHLLHNPHDRARLRLRASDVVRERYDLETMVKATERVYFEARGN